MAEKAWCEEEAEPFGSAPARTSMDQSATRLALAEDLGAVYPPRVELASEGRTARPDDFGIDFHAVRWMQMRAGWWPEEDVPGSEHRLGEPS